MRCERARELMAEALEGAPGAELNAHLGTCPDCSAAWSRLAAVDALLRAQGLVDPPAGFGARLELRLAEAAPPRVAWRQRGLQAATILMGIALMSLGAFSLGRSWLQALGGRPATAPVDHMAWRVGLALETVMAETDGSLVAWALYGALAAAIAAMWFGALVLPRLGRDTLRTDS